MYALAALLIGIATPCEAHGFGGSGFVHPLTGFDHMLAMLAVGAWSAQRGGAAIYLLPALFVASMAAGAGAALLGMLVPASEYVIALSVLLLGAAIALRSAPGLPLAALATALFGVAHGFSHGVEIPRVAAPLTYVAGFLVTTAGLHVAGAVGALLVLERERGAAQLRWSGGLISAAGAYLLLRLLAQSQ